MITPGRLLGLEGHICTPIGGLKVSIGKLADLITSPSVFAEPITTLGVLAIIGFGSAFYQNTDRTERRRRWFFVGPIEEHRKKVRPIQPEDADFLIITESPSEPIERLYKARWEEGYSYSYLAACGVHVVVRSVGQFITGQDTDSVSITGLTQGVPIALDPLFLPRLGVYAGMMRPARMKWRDVDMKCVGSVV